MAGHKSVRWGEWFDGVVMLHFDDNIQWDWTRFADASGLPYAGVRRWARGGGMDTDHVMPLAAFLKVDPIVILRALDGQYPEPLPCVSPFGTTPPLPSLGGDAAREVAGRAPTARRRKRK